ncbi:MAG: copper chaperone PCu(A)C [Microbacteriaceae bacterium]|nr:copper chaperone PCu(A)C [Burkholderiaceae bacterium]
MNRSIHRRRVLQGMTAGIALLAQPARACEFFSTHLRVTHPWTRATTIGDRSAVLCMKFDEVTRADRLIGIETPVASHADMAGPLAGVALDFAIPEGRETLLDETGQHLRLLGLKLPLEVGRSYPLTLFFEHGSPLRASLSVDYARFG